MVQKAFQHRPGRVIALGRVVLAFLFLLVLWFEHGGPGQHSGSIAGAIDLATIFAGYAAWAVLLVLVTWRSWWLDHRLADVSHLVDIAACAILIFFADAYAGPFYTFFVFLTLSAALRWNARETALTAAAIILFFLTAGTTQLATATADFDIRQLLMRASYLVLLSLIVIWFRINELPSPGDADDETPPDDMSAVETAMRRVLRRLRARRVVFAWSQSEEPWVNVAQIDADGIRTERIGPADYGGLAPNRLVEAPLLFDIQRSRGLTRAEADAHQAAGLTPDFNRAFAERFELRTGLAIPVRARDYQGEMFAVGIDGLCAQDLRVAEPLAPELTALLDQSSMAAVSEEAAVNRARMALARDLHDGVVQVLAGASFRLEGLKASIQAGEDPEPEIDAVKAELKEEQRNVRAFITGLRSGRGWGRTTDLSSGIPIVAEQLQRRWGLRCSLSGVVTPTEGPLWIEHELHQIIHESAANAVRHGDATALTINLARQGDDLELIIVDNGKGLPVPEGGGDEIATPANGLPWSVGERVRGLGGVLSMSSANGGTRLHLRVPVGALP
jgi:signal transduction histidine kinase